MSEQMQPVIEPHNNIQWHQLLAKLLELVLTPVDITVQTELQVMSDPPKVDILLLRRKGDRWTPDQHSLLPDGIRESRAAHILVEFKATESINEEGVRQALGYDFFYRKAQSLPRAAVQTFILSAKTPRAAVLSRLGFRPTPLVGVYENIQSVTAPVRLLVANELSPETHNAFVQCFASRQRVQSAAFRRLEQVNWATFSDAFWDYLFGLRASVTWKGVEMNQPAISPVSITPEFIMEKGKEIRKILLAHLSPQERKQVIGTAPLEERLAGLAPEERLAGLAPEERLAGLAPEERLAGLAPEELAALLEQIEAYLSAHASKKDQ